jgi:uncharacterized protein YuzE
MKVTYDDKYDILYVQFKETTVTTKHLDDSIALDYDSDGVIAGIEVLNAQQRLHFELPLQVPVEEYRENAIA